MCPVRSQKGFEIDRDPGIRFSLAVDGPVQHRAAHERLHGARKPRDRTSTNLAGADGILEECAKLRAKLAGAVPASRPTSARVKREGPNRPMTRTAETRISESGFRRVRGDMRRDYKRMAVHKQALTINEQTFINNQLPKEPQ